MNDSAPTLRPADGVYYGMPAADYHAVESMSASGAKKIRKSPAHFRLMRDTPSEPTAQMQFGTCVHNGALEPDSLATRVVGGPDEAPTRPSSKQLSAKKPSPDTLSAIAFWESFDAEHAGKIILSRHDFDRARRCIDAVHEHPAARYLLEDAQIEVSIFWQDKLFEVPCKARLDARKHGGIVDLKTCQDASPEGFARAIGAYDYHEQGWAYFSGCEHVLDATPEFFAFVCVETEPPHAVAVYHLGRESLMAGARLWDEALSRYKAALAAGKWTGYPETINTINAPRWKLRFDI